MIDSMPFHFRTWLETFHDLGVDITKEQLETANLGVISEVIRRLLGKNTSDEEVMRIATMKEERFKHTYRNHLKLLPGLSEFLSRSKSLGIPMAIGTSAMYNNIDYVVDGLNLRSYFNAYTGDEDVENGKPHPETFLVAADRLNIPAKDCVVFEDSLAGVEASQRAGMQVVHLATSNPKLDIAEWNNVLISIQDYTTITPEVVVELARRKQS